MEGKVKACYIAGGLMDGWKDRRVIANVSEKEREKVECFNTVALAGKDLPKD